MASSSAEITAPVVKIVIVGDGAIGKTCLLQRFCNGDFSGEYVPTVFDNKVQPAIIDGNPVSISLWDTAGQEDYDRLRPLSYPGTNVFILAFSLVSPLSFKHVISKWIREIMHHCPSALTVLVGTKLDLRTDPKVLAELQRENLGVVTPKDGEEVRLYIKSDRYFECSAKSGEGVERIFHDSVRLFLQRQSRPSASSGSGTPKKSKKCLIL